MIEYSRDRFGPNINIRAQEGALEVGVLQADLEPGGIVCVKAADVEESHTRRGIGTRMYEELRDWILEIGRSEIRGSLEGSGIVQIREKVFGPGNTRYLLGEYEMTYEEAVKHMDVDFGYLIAVTKLKDKAYGRRDKETDRTDLVRC